MLKLATALYFSNKRSSLTTNFSLANTLTYYRSFRYLFLRRRRRPGRPGLPDGVGPSGWTPDGDPATPDPGGLVGHVVADADVAEQVRDEQQPPVVIARQR